MASVRDGWPQYWAAWGDPRPVWQVRRPGGSGPATSASPSPTPSATPTSSAISQSDQHDYARLRAAGTFLTGPPINDRVKDRGLNLANEANRSAHCARSPFKAKAGKPPAPVTGRCPASSGSYSVLGGEISHATKKIPHPIRHYGGKPGSGRGGYHGQFRHEPDGHAYGARRPDWIIPAGKSGRLPDSARRVPTRRMRGSAADRPEDCPGAASAVRTFGSKILPLPQVRPLNVIFQLAVVPSL